jgi:cytochrome b involved in lipid metabolism
MIKKIVTFSLFVFASGFSGIIIAGFLVSQQNGGKQTAPSPASAAKAGVGNITLSATEVAKHNSASDCWQIIENKVYDFTNYLNQHPGGADIIIAYCGQQSTSAFSTKGGQGRNHSNFAWNLLANYLVGTLNQKISAAAAGSAQGQAAAGSNPAPAGSAANSAAPASPNGNGTVALTAAEVAKHGAAGSCWLIISGKIYDVSGYLGKHPAGAGAITPYCGQDATSAFTGSSGGHVHSGFAWGLLGGFYIGTVGQQASASTIQQNAQQAQSAAQQAPTGGGGDQEGGD